ncbi:MAG: S9 family peptidase, partial [Hyphomicrobiaceae bacterium]
MTTSSSSSVPPTARKETVTATWHGVELKDDYHWLRAANWQEAMRDPSTLPSDIRAHLEAENAHTQAIMADTEGLQEQLFEEMKARIKEDDSTVPTPDGPWSYYVSFITGGQYPILCRQPRDGGDEIVLLDGNLEAKDQAYWQLGGADHSPDHSLMVFGTDTNGSEYYTLRVRNLATGEMLDDVIPNTSGGAVWAKDSRTFYYMRLDDNHRPLYVYRHTLGTPVDDDELIYEEKDAGFYAHLGETHSGDFILIDVSDHESSEVYLLDAHDPKAVPKLIAPRREKREYSVEHHGDRLYILTNSGGAEDFRVCTVPVSDPAEDNWQELIAHNPGTLVLSLVMFKDHMVRLERSRSLPRIVIRRLSDDSEHEIAFAEAAYGLGMSAGYEFDTTALRFTYASMTTPSQVFDYDMESRERVLRKTQEVPSGHDPADYVTDRLFATAGDGTEVPITVLHRRDTVLDGSAPLLLYGYGSYGISMPASFSTTRLSLVDRGFVFAVAHVRGGKDMGYRWYTDGKRENKINTFTDFIDCGEHLVNQGFTQRGQIVANGGSAGGLLMGAVANMAPDVFLGIIANVPFVDVLNTILDKDLPLTPMEWPEWGNPITSLEDFKNIQSYSPYDNVAALDYPHILALAGLTDPRVTYWEPAKWVAKLREFNTSERLVLLKTNMDAGHGGASGR